MSDADAQVEKVEAVVKLTMALCRGDSVEEAAILSIALAQAATHAGIGADRLARQVRKNYRQMEKAQREATAKMRKGMN